MKYEEPESVLRIREAGFQERIFQKPDSIIFLVLLLKVAGALIPGHMLSTLVIAIA